LRKLDGLEAAWVNSQLIMNNATCLSAPVASGADLRKRFRAAIDDAARVGLPWALFVYEPYVAGFGVEAAAGEFGLTKAMAVEVMTGDLGSLRPLARTPPGIEYRRIATPGDAHAAMAINLRAYGMPESIAESVVATEAYFRDPARDFGYLGLVDGAPVSTATVVGLEGWLYVAAVATEPDRQKKGYAEAVMRHALREASSALGVTRTSLDATPMGAPLYLQMGYERTGEEWSMYHL
jgi:GNAT superfamily N-acetyltransferase